MHILTYINLPLSSWWQLNLFPERKKRPLKFKIIFKTKKNFFSEECSKHDPPHHSHCYNVAGQEVQMRDYSVILSKKRPVKKNWKSKRFEANQRTLYKHNNIRYHWNGLVTLKGSSSTDRVLQSAFIWRSHHKITFIDSNIVKSSLGQYSCPFATMSYFSVAFYLKVAPFQFVGRLSS